MKSLYSLRGIVTVLNTPFTAEEAVDVGAFDRHVVHALRAGVAGMLVPAMASEVQKLTLPERIALVETAMTRAADKVPVIAGAGESDRARRKEIVTEYLRHGCDCVLLQIPFASAEQYREEVLRIAELGPRVIMLQDWDANGAGLPIPVICQLFDEVPAFRCLKIETSSANQKYSAVLKATDGRLHLSGGWAVTTMIEGLERGIHAFMPTGLHEVYTLIYRLFATGATAAAERWHHRILPILAFSNQHLDISIHFFKRLLHRQGIFATSRVRPPSGDFDAVHAARSEYLIRLALPLLAEAARELATLDSAEAAFDAPPLGL